MRNAAASPLPNPLSMFLDNAVRFGGADREAALRLALTMLASTGRAEPLSALNHDSAPVQFCISSAQSGLRYRLLADPAADEPDMRRRYQLSRTALGELAALSGQPMLGRMFQDTLDSQIDEDNFDYPDGVLWLAAGLDVSDGLAIYIDARKGGRDAALARLRRWFHATAGSSAELTAFLDALEGHARLMCLGLEGVSPDKCRAKVYWRLDRVRRLDSLGIPALAHPQILGFLDRAAGDRELRLDGVVLNAGFHVGTARPTDIKIDLCCCPNCLRWDRDEAFLRIAALADWLGLPPPPAEALAFGELANIGVGLDHRLETRMNVYLKPFETGAPERRDNSIGQRDRSRAAYLPVRSRRGSDDQGQRQPLSR